ncbi:tetratricopeptide repeat protein [Desulfosporosinus burensis]
MKKKSQRIFAGILAVLISIAMVGSGLLVFFFTGDEQPYGSNASPLAANTKAGYQAQKLRIDAMVEQAKKDPENELLQTSLGNEYYNAGVAAQEVAPTEVQENFKHAVEVYQNVLKTKKDVNIMVDMATSAFYSEDYELAEKSYQEALKLDPNFLFGLINYGIFLSQAKQDWAGAVNQWQKALPLAQKSSDKEQIQAMINQAQSQLKASGNQGLSNPNLP